MFTLPKLRHAQPWHEQLKVRQWVNQFFALGSRKRNYHVTIGRNPHGHLAWVHAEARRVYVSSSLLPVPPDHIRFDPVDEHRRTELLLKALLAHEAGHVRFSGPNPGGKLGELWNSLEDERIERLMAREFHGLGAAFTFIGDIAAETGRQAGAWSYTAMEGALIWRFEHDRFHAHWAPRAEDHDIWHSTVRPLVESAWTLGTSEEVLAVAGEILEVLRQHQHSLTPPPAPEPEEQTPPPEQDPAATEPEDKQEPGEQEEEPETDSGEGQGQSSDDPADGEGPPESGEAEPGGGQDDSGEGGEQPDGGAGQPDTHTDGSSEEDATDGEGPSDRGAGEPGGDQAQSGEGDSSDDSGPPRSGEAEPRSEQGDAGEGDGPGGDEEQPDANPDGSSAGNVPADGGMAQPGDDQAPSGEGDSSGKTGPPDSSEEPSTGDQDGTDRGESSDTNGPSSGTDQSGQPGRIPSPTSNVSPEQQAAENADDTCSPDAWEQVSASGADADERDGDAEQRRAQEQEGSEASGEQQESTPAQPQNSGDRSGDPEQQNAPGQGQGRRASTQDTELPPMPQPDHGSGMIIAQDVEGHARRLAPLLKPPERPGRTRPHRSKGRYDARRDARDAERVFVRKTVASRPLPIRVRLLIDISISMGGEPIRCARAAAGMVVRAAALSGSSAEVHLFNTRHQAVITGPMPYLTAQALIAGIEVGGYTCLSPALAVLSDSPAHPLEKELIVIVCDGQLDETDYQQCAQIVKRGKGAGKEYLPVLISEAASDHQEWREIFGSALPCESVTDLGLNIKAALTNLRSRLGS